MGVRTQRGTLESAVSCSDGKKALFLLNSADPALTSGRFTGGRMTISNCRTYGSDYYFLFYIDGHAAGETVAITDQNSGDHSLQAIFDNEWSTDDSGEEMAQLRGGEEKIEVKISDNNGTGENIIDFLEGCEITLEIYHSVNISVSAPTAAQTDDGRINISWRAATLSGAIGEITYSIVCNLLADPIVAGTMLERVLEIQDAWYGQTARISIRATCSGAVAQSSTIQLSIKDTELSAPSSLEINGQSEYTGATATLSWLPSSVSYRPADVTYRIRFGNTVVGETSDTHYIVPEEVTSNFETTTITVAGVARSREFARSNSVSYTYDSGHQYISYRYNGGWVQCVPYIFYHGGWHECIPNYFDNGWTECSG